MIELRIRQHPANKYGWHRVEALLLPSEVDEWRVRFGNHDGTHAIWKLAMEVIAATSGRKHWVSPVGNALEMSWEVKPRLDEGRIWVDTPTGPAAVMLLVDNAPIAAVEEWSGVGAP